MFANNNIETVVNRVDAVDVDKKQVRLADGRDIQYDKLLLSLPSMPFIPPIDAAELEGVYTLRSLFDAERIRDYMEKREPFKLVFVGAGFISLEVAALVKDMQDKNFEV